MKIGIQTLPLNTNYGGILQAYALQTIMERLGHKVSLIELYPKPENFLYGKCLYVMEKNYHEFKRK